jgi:hypothetical protein
VLIGSKACRHLHQLHHNFAILWIIYGIMSYLSWNTVSASSESHRGAEAAANGCMIEVWTGIGTTTIVGPVHLARFGITTLFRFVVLCPTTGRNIAALSMPTDLPWIVTELKKIKGKTSKAYRIVIRLHPGNKEGYDCLTITIPLGLNNSSSSLEQATLFGEACVHASQVVMSSLPQEVLNRAVNEISGHLCG